MKVSIQMLRITIHIEITIITLNETCIKPTFASYNSSADCPSIYFCFCIHLLLFDHILLQGMVGLLFPAIARKIGEGPASHRVDRFFSLSALTCFKSVSVTLTCASRSHVLGWHCFLRRDCGAMDIVHNTLKCVWVHLVDLVMLLGGSCYHTGKLWSGFPNFGLILSSFSE